MIAKENSCYAQALLSCDVSTWSSKHVYLIPGISRNIQQRLCEDAASMQDNDGLLQYCLSLLLTGIVHAAIVGVGNCACAVLWTV